jgi:Xaa-Pro aminopeptidase
MNPIFWDTVGEIPNVTRPCWLWIPAAGNTQIIASYVDQNRFEHLGINTHLWVSRDDMVALLKNILSGTKIVAMEYSSMGNLPRNSKVDGGTLELIRSLGPDIAPSADLVQHATQRWDHDQFSTHQTASVILTATVKSAFNFIGEEVSKNHGRGPTEFEVAQFIRNKFAEKGLRSPDGPVVAANAHSADPHFEPTEKNSLVISHGDWVLIDLWGKTQEEEAMYADITWTAYVGNKVPNNNQEVFDVVTGGRDAALSLMERAHKEGKLLPGWAYDKEAREYISNKGYGNYFSHRLGHSLGREVHGNAVNLDGWETHDSRLFMPDIAVTIEPGIYMPGHFGVRSEIDVFYSSSGPMTTTEVQTSPYLITA